MDGLLTVNEAATFTRLKPKTIYTYVAKKKIPHIKLGSRVLFDKKQLTNWILGNSVDCLQNQIKA